MATPHVMDQLITSVCRLAKNEKPKAIKSASALVHPADLLQLIERLDALEPPVPFEVTEDIVDKLSPITFALGEVSWTCTPDCSIAEGRPLIVIRT